MTGRYTDGPWRTISQGGSSTVVSAAKPRRNDNRIPTYGYRENGEHCIGYPFRDEDGRCRWDFICFSHDDARLIASAPDLLEALIEIRDYSGGAPSALEDEYVVERMLAAIAKAGAA